MGGPNPELESDAPIEVVEAATLFASATPRRRMCGGLVRLPSGRLLLTFALGAGGDSRRNDGAIMLTWSDDDGRTWDEPRPLYAYPGWDCFPMSGPAALAGDQVRLTLGRIKLDYALGGDEPFAGWWTAFTDSRDGGETWSEPAPTPELFPCWTEFYGASNPHPIAGNRLLWAVIGTQGRDVGWRAGVSVSDGAGSSYTPPVIIAAAPDRNYSDTDLVRLADGRFLAISREHVTKESVFAHSADEGATWTPIRRTGFKGANIKLYRLRSGLVLCVYRDEDPARRGVSCSVSADGGDSWRFVGQLYAADPAVPHRPGHLSGYPDLVSLDGAAIACVLHTYPDAAGRVDLHFLRLRDRT
jgi:hypothetical protein